MITVMVTVEDLKRATSTAKDKAVPHLLCLYVKKDEGFEVAGTGFFVRWQGRQYVVSAGHVFGHEQSMLVYTGEGSRMLSLGRRASTWISAEENDPDLRYSPLDLAAVEVPLDFLPAGKRAYDLQTPADSKSVTWERVWVGGFPAMASIHKADGIEGTLFHYNTREISVRWSAWEPYTWDVHLAMDFPLWGNVNDQGEPIDFRSLNPKGMSGAPVWGLRREASQRTEDANWQVALVGILQAVEEKGPTRYLVATRVEKCVGCLPALTAAVTKSKVGAG